jgi:transposase
MDFNHKLSAELVRKHDLLAFEDLRIRNMVRNHSLAKSISDAGWDQLRRLSEYKAARRRKLAVRVPPAFSTQECYFCGTLSKVALSVRVFDCGGCKRTLDRDFNAAWIVLKRGLAQVGQGMPELKPAETGPLPPQTTVVASPVEEAGTTRHEKEAANPRFVVAGGCHAPLIDPRNRTQHEPNTTRVMRNSSNQASIRWNL